MKKETFKCKICGAEFDSKQKLLKHISVEEPDYTVKEYVNHFELNDEIPMCISCNERQQHFVGIHGIYHKSGLCDQCLKKFNIKDMSKEPNETDIVVKKDENEQPKDNMSKKVELKTDLVVDKTPYVQNVETEAKVEEHINKETSNEVLSREEQIKKRARELGLPDYSFAQGTIYTSKYTR